MIDKSYKFRMYPNEIQSEQIKQNCGCYRFVYNHFLYTRIMNYEATGESFGYYDCCACLPDLKKKYPWLRNADSTSLQVALKNLDNAFQMFFIGLKDGRHVGYPKYKTRSSHRLKYTCKYVNDNIEIIDEKHIKLPKLGVVECRVSRKVEGRILRATIEITPSGKFYVSICCTDVEMEQYPKTGHSVGIDMGIKDLIVDSDGNKYPNNKYIKMYEKRLAIEQRKLSRKTRGSKRWEKQRIVVARIQEKIANMRRDNIQKVTTELVKNNDIICMEDLKPSNMMKNHHLAKAVADASFREIRRELEYKSEWHGRKIQCTDPFFPSSQKCSCCGYINPEIKDLSVRDYICPACGAHHDRDVNASVNIRDEGLKLINSK
ncbi:MAG: IS200/IS605 family element RNA-guided endonuclease TnpB [Oscillospiraceae bacterium]|nr:IS200/IS605 family element RNA-guided endonuclease TnpB [Oscillospiraceae bacterium]